MGTIILARLSGYGHNDERRIIDEPKKSDTTGVKNRPYFKEDNLIPMVLAGTKLPKFDSSFLIDVLTNTVSVGMHEPRTKILVLT